MNIEINRQYCIIPFRYDRSAFVKRDMWIEQTPTLDRDALYDFVETGRQSMRIYALDFNRCDRFSKFCKKQTSVMSVNGRETRFRVVNSNGKSWLTPRLVLSQSASVGLLWLPVEIAGNPTLGEVIDFNYAFQKFDSGQGKKFICNEGEWCLADLVNWLLAPLGDGLRLFEGYRAHIFTYLLVDGVDDLDTMRGDILNLVHGRNSRYASIDDEFDNGTMLQTFKNMYVGSSVEGGCMIGLLKHDDSDGFMRNYPNTTFREPFPVDIHTGLHAALRAARHRQQHSHGHSGRRLDVAHRGGRLPRPRGRHLHGPSVRIFLDRVALLAPRPHLPLSEPVVRPCRALPRA